MRSAMWTAFLAMFLSSGVRGAELFEYGRPTRALGMGGVYLPFVTPADATIWNPAVLGDTKVIAWEVFDVGLGVNGQDAMELAEIFQGDSCEGSSCYSELYGVPLWLGYHGGTKFAMPRVGAALFSSGYLSGTLHNPAFPSLNLTYLNDYIYMAAYGFPVMQNLTAGVAVKRIHRSGGTEDISLSTVTSGDSSIVDEFDKKGIGYGADLGIQWRLPGAIMDSIVALHWQDLGYTSFNALSDGGAPPPVRDNLSIAAGSELDWPGFDLRMGMEYRHALNTGEEIGKKIHLGAEVGLPLVDVRFGLNQGYPTIGGAIDLFFFRLDAASYTEETGVYPGQSPSHRYKIGLSMDMSFDADFKFTTDDGKKRKLKQRR